MEENFMNEIMTVDEAFNYEMNCKWGPEVI